MPIHVRGAAEHNLKSINVDFGDGLTVVTGVSGSGKSSLVLDTVYHEARRRFVEIYALGSSRLRLAPAQVAGISGLGPTVAVGQNLLNRNPGSSLATASGLHPCLRLLFANFGRRHCPRCSAVVEVRAPDAIVERIVQRSAEAPLVIEAPLVRGAAGSHATLLDMLLRELGVAGLRVDGRAWSGRRLDGSIAHDIDVELARFDGPTTARGARQVLDWAQQLGVLGVRLVPALRPPSRRSGIDHTPPAPSAAGSAAALGRHSAAGEDLAFAAACLQCGQWLADLRPTHFHRRCRFCGGAGCDRCHGSGLHPLAAAVLWQGERFDQLLQRTVDEAAGIVAQATWPTSAERLRREIERRLEALATVGLGYIQLDRPSPTLSRGEAQRLRLATALTSRLEDIVHVLDEPTVGQHPHDVARLLPAFRRLGGPVVYVEHDRLAAAVADEAIDIGPGAGADGGRLIFQGSPGQLWSADTLTGRCFSFRERLPVAARRAPASAFLRISGATARNLAGIDVPLPLERLTVVTGVSGSGKSTLVEEVLVASLRTGEPVGCRAIEGPPLAVTLVDQSPIGRNPRSNPATYTKLADIVRDTFAAETGLSPSHFSFNRPEGACPTCGGMGAVEVQMRYLPSVWIPCSTCGGRRFNEEVLSATIERAGRQLSIADLYATPIDAAAEHLLASPHLSRHRRQALGRILSALTDVGLGYVPLGQPSPTLSGGEAQRVKLAKHLGRKSLAGQLLVLDEPSTGLHPRDIGSLLAVLDRLVRSGATVVIVEHNTDVIRAADWVVDLGPGAGPLGGQLVYAGSLTELAECPASATARSLREEEALGSSPPVRPAKPSPGRSVIEVRNARMHNLKSLNVDIPKRALTVVTGVSGSGKSSLVTNVLDAEARRRFLETLAMYERQSVREGPEALVSEIRGLGVALAVDPRRSAYEQRSTVGTATEVAHHLANLLAWIGKRRCLQCGQAEMERRLEWQCGRCGAVAPIAAPRHFSAATYGSACRACQGIGSLPVPEPEKLIVRPERPLCGGAMHSPGFFPKGYLCAAGNGGYDMLQALAQRYGFDPAVTPWCGMSSAAREAFLFGDPEPLEVTFRSRTGRTQVRRERFPGFYGWIRDWDTGGTYTRLETCAECHGRRLRPEFLAVTLDGQDRYELGAMGLGRLATVLEAVASEAEPATDGEAGAWRRAARPSLATARRRLRFLGQVGLGYLHLDRLVGSLSAGEAQRARLASLLGSGLTHLTVLLDEPSRGMHPSEVEALLRTLIELRDEGNTVIVVEHDPLFIRGADHIVDMGPGAGSAGGRIAAQGPPDVVAAAPTPTGKWLRGEGSPNVRRQRRAARRWLELDGARENNLRGEPFRLPLGVLAGVCGVSGAGKSTLLVDTVARALAPVKHTTSVAHEPLAPGAFDRLEGAPARTIVVDQARAGLHSPAAFMGLEPALRRLYADSEDARALGLKEADLAQRCSACGGRGAIRIDMGFLPSVDTPCDTCRGTGRRPEAFDVRIAGLSLPEVLALTTDEVAQRFGDAAPLARPLGAMHDAGLGYLVLQQPGRELSGGEAQRLKIARELARPAAAETLYILDEPTVGQHISDVARLVEVLHRLVEGGHTVAVIEHHPHLLAACDWLVELGPGGGPDGGHILACGTPETVGALTTPTAPYLRQVLEAS